MIKALADILFPPVCVLCDKRSHEKGFCDTCSALLEEKRVTGPLCVRCGTPFVSPKAIDHECGRCLDESPSFASARSAFIYEGSVLEAVHRFKYAGDTSLAGPIARAILGSLDISGPFLIVPVPLHTSKLKKRGFNQSLLIAREISKLTGEPLEFRRLKRTRDTGQQVGLKADQRRENVAGAFTLLDESMFKGRKVLLVDDVATTGATLNECSKVLKKAGAEIFALTVARAVKL